MKFQTFLLTFLLSLLLQLAQGSQIHNVLCRESQASWSQRYQHKLLHSGSRDHLQQLTVSRGLRPYERLRRLLQSNGHNAKRVDAIPDVPQCMWNDIRQACTPSQLVYLAIDAAPTTLLHKAATAAYDRNLVCSVYVDAVRCDGDIANRCMYWNQSCVGADAYELINWLGGGVGILDGQATVAAFTCAGTEAAPYRICRTAAEAGPKGICNKLPGCHWVNLTAGDCLPKSWDSKTFKQVQDIRSRFDDFAVGVWGSCAGACYVRQAATCQKNYNNSAVCNKKPYCVWEYDAFEKKQVCQHKDTAARGRDAFSQAYYTIKMACNKATTQDACELPRVVPKNIGRYRGARPTQSIVQEQALSCQL